MRGIMNREELVQNYLAGEFYQPYEVGAEFRKEKLLGIADTFLREYLPQKVLRLSFVKTFTHDNLKLRRHYVLEKYLENIKLLLSDGSLGCCVNSVNKGDVLGKEKEKN